MFWLFDTRNPTLVLLTLMFGVSLGQGIMFSLHASLMPELFGTSVRDSGVSIGFQVGAALFGGLTPLIADLSVTYFHDANWPISAYLVVLAVVSLLAILLSRETARNPMME